ncbi:hypothetical protein CH299_23110 [Rhodococcus sp. 14-2686-1-2]|nr:hypothetical protein CH301_22590 [Rhodococcus sp. 15-1189-1-1a]OZF10050.1 hypothetical protein CH299_23110 [Rhodococcus sp. 14-2686-1-2]
MLYLGWQLMIVAGGAIVEVAVWTWGSCVGRSAVVLIGEGGVAGTAEDVSASDVVGVVPQAERRTAQIPRIAAAIVFFKGASFGVASGRGLVS